MTATLNASILPIAARTAEVVAGGVHTAGLAAPVMVMRGDGGATDLEGFRRAPARTLYSGPAASVAGALRFAGVTDGVVVEVGGTSTNVAAVKGGRPLLSYVQVASHSTALRAVDVRVVGVAGGSMLRVRKGRVYGVGPRSAHIAGLPYACFAAPGGLRRRSGRLVAPRGGRPGRPPCRGAGRRPAPGAHEHVRRQRAGHHRARGLRVRACRTRRPLRSSWPAPSSAWRAGRWRGGCWRRRRSRSPSWSIG